MSSSEQEPPSESQPQIFQYIETAVDQRLTDYDAWPANIFKLELEKAGVYQNFAGRALAELRENRTIEREEANNYPYIVAAGDNAPSSSSTVRSMTEKFYTLTDGDDTKPLFGEIAFYATLCTEISKLSDDVDAEAHPKDEYASLLHGNTERVDCLLRVNQEYFPVEVHNGMGLITTGSERKRRQVDRNSAEGNNPSNPVLGSRIIGKNMRKYVRDRNGTVIDTGAILACEETNDNNLSDALEFLNISELVEIVPPIETSEGYKLTGEKYENFLNSHIDRLLPEKLSSSASNLPEEYRKAVTGGLQLQYVNTYYRQAADVIGKEAGWVLQFGFHSLLRQSGGFSRSKLVEEGWDQFSEEYRNIEKAKAREGAIRERTRDYISELESENVISDKSGGLYARASIHPHASLKFPDGYYRGPA